MSNITEKSLFLQLTKRFLFLSYAIFLFINTFYCFMLIYFLICQPTFEFKYSFNYYLNKLHYFSNHVGSGGEWSRGGRLYVESR